MPSWFIPALVASIFFSVHIWKVNRLIPLPTLILDRPFVQASYAEIVADVTRDRAFTELNGTGSGYDPFRMAGVYVTALADSTSRVAVLFDRLSRAWLSPALSVRWIVYLCLLMWPLFYLGAFHLFGADNSTAVAGLGLAVTSFGNFDVALNDAVLRGWVFLSTGLSLAILSAGLAHRVNVTASRGLAAIYSLVLSITLAFHPFAFASALVPALVLTVRSRRRFAWGVFIGSIVVAVVLNSVWLRSLFASHDVFTARPFDRSSLSLWITRFQTNTFDSKSWARLLTGGLVVAAFIPGVVHLARRDQTLGWMFAVWLAAVLLALSIGNRLPFVGLMFPASSLSAIVPVLLVPAGFFLSHFFLRPGTLRLIFFLWFGWFQMTWPTYYLWMTFLRSPNPRQNAVDEFERALLQLPSNGRILVEDGVWSGDPNDERMPLPVALLPLSSHHEWIANMPEGPIYSQFNAFAFRSIRGERSYLFDRELSRYNKTTLLETLRYYDVHFVVSFSAAAQATFERYPDVFKSVKVQPAEGLYRVYRVTAYRPNPFISGSGRVRASYGRLEIDDVAKGEVVLSYHWHDRLLVDTADVQLKPRFVGDDPTPFIALTVPAMHRRIVITSR